MSRSPSRTATPSCYPTSAPQHFYPHSPPARHLSPSSAHESHQKLSRTRGHSHLSIPHAADRDSCHRAQQAEGLYRYPHRPYGAPFHPDFRLPLPPHPPAPPTPPRVPSTRDATPRITIPKVHYYHPPTGYEPQHPPHRPSGPSDRLVPSHRVDVDQERSNLILQDSMNGVGSEGLGRRSGSVPGNEQEQCFPSPVDPEGIRGREEQNLLSVFQPASSGECGSYGGDDDGDEEDGAINNSSTNTSRNSESHGYDGQDDDISLEDCGNMGIESQDTCLEMPNSQKRPNSDYYPSAHHQAQFIAISKETSTSPENAPRGYIGLNSLVDNDPGERPAYPIPTIIKCAILGSPHQRLTLSELYIAMEARFEYYRKSNKKAWRNSVRHNLSLSNQFEKKQRPITEPGKGHYWTVVPDMPQGNKRERKRNKKPGKRVKAAMAAAASEAARIAAQRAAARENPDAQNAESTSSETRASAGADDAVIQVVPIDPQLTAATTVYPAVVRGHNSGTVPASAGSYAAVTGALPAPPPIQRYVLRPWDGNPSVPSPRDDDDDTNPSVSPEPASQAEQRPAANATPGRQQTGSTTEDGERQTEVGTQSPATPPQFGQPSLSPASFDGHAPLPSGTATLATTVRGRGVDDAPRTESGIAHAQRRHSGTPAAPAPGTAAPQSAFAALAAELEREGTGAWGSGGPAVRVRKRRLGGGKRRAVPGGSDSDGNETSDNGGDDDEYLPAKKRRR